MKRNSLILTCLVLVLMAAYYAESKLNLGSEIVLPEKERIVLAFGGDVNLMDGDYVMPTLRASKTGLSGVLTGGLLQEMQGADILLLNNEFAYTDNGTLLAGKGYNFRADPENVEVFAEMGTDVAFLANNHVFDYGAEGLSDTLETLNNAGIAHIGAGNDLNESMSPAYLSVGDKIIAYVGAGCIERYELFTPGSTTDSPGIFRADEINCKQLLDVIGEAAEKSDFVVVNLHWGIEHTTVLEDYQRLLGKMCIDAGADAVIGAHPHVLQGAEFYNGKPIIYSLGNFWFSSAFRDTCLLELILEGDKVSVKFLPCVTGEGVTELKHGDEGQRILDYYESISFGVNIDEAGIISPAIP